MNIYRGKNYHNFYFQNFFLFFFLCSSESAVLMRNTKQGINYKSRCFHIGFYFIRLNRCVTSCPGITTNHYQSLAFPYFFGLSSYHPLFISILLRKAGRLEQAICHKVMIHPLFVFGSIVIQKLLTSAIRQKNGAFRIKLVLQSRRRQL